MVLRLTGVMQLLFQHVRRHERNALLGYAETTLSIGVVVLADHAAFLESPRPYFLSSLVSFLLREP